MADDKQLTLGDFLTDDQIAQALTIWRRSRAPARQIADDVIKPNMAEINRRIGQENDPMYLAYACEYVFNETEKR